MNDHRRARRWQVAIVAAVMAAAAIVATLTSPACSDAEETPPIRMDQLRLTVQNRSDRAWAEVEIWVNDHYRMQVPSLAAGQVVAADLRNFVAGFGQRFDPRKQVVYGVEVSAREGSRREIKLTWGKGKKH